MRLFRPFSSTSQSSPSPEDGTTPVVELAPLSLEPFTPFNAPLLPGACGADCACNGGAVLCNAAYVKANPGCTSVAKAGVHYAEAGAKEGRYKALGRMAFKYQTIGSWQYKEALATSHRLGQFTSDFVQEKDVPAFIWRGIQPHQLHEATLVAFDLFDTLVYRATTEPHDIFDLVAWDTGIADFTKQRIAAEERCKEAFEVKQYLLEDIYRELPYTDADRRRAYTAELAHEQANLAVRHNLFNFAKALQAKGLRVIVVSDFYLTKADLRHILPADITEAFDEIYVSADFGVCKHDGQLFEQLSQQVPELASQGALFLGDNWRSDFGIPQQYGYSAFRTPTLYETSRRERGFFELLTYCPPEPRRDSLARFARNDKHWSRDVPALYAACAMAFVAQHLKALYDNGNYTTPVVFLARDGHLACQVFKALYPEIPAIEVANSRSLNFHALVNKVKDLKAVFKRDGKPKTLQQTLFNRLGYTVDDLPEGQMADALLHTPELFNGGLTEQLVDFCREQTDSYRAYLSEQGVASGNDYLVFDIGYRGTAAKAFEQLLPESQCNWVYLTTFKKMLHAKHPHFAFMPEFDAERYGDILPALEALLSDNATSSAHYFNAGKLVRREGDNEALNTLMSELQERAVALVNAHPQAFKRPFPLTSNPVITLMDYLTLPSADFARHFVGVPSEDSFAGASSYYVSPKFLTSASMWQGALNALLQEQR
ncbi:HAD family hydrolase [uncultured Gilvimarinus sp.]|uniref:HAD family hydrolase n=1 Tax=uncultured Gilvimarinus sp. TaxID=1689143 RepID=UPI0030ED8FAB